jgi:hypothetical protein
MDDADAVEQAEQLAAGRPWRYGARQIQTG